MPELDTDAVVLGRDQQRVLDRAIDGENLLITGPAGTGKSIVLREIVRTLRDSGRRVAVTASTGIAALNVGGSTIHSFLGTGLTGSAEQAQQRRLTVKPWTEEAIGPCDTLILDEVSMCSGDYLGLIDWWLGHVRQGLWGQTLRPFGGLQVILVGDFLQLPPIPAKPPDPRTKHLFAFQSPSWSRGGFRVEVLHETFRQRDAAFVAQLGGIRTGDFRSDVRDFFAPCVGRGFVDPTNLFPLNDETNRYNARRLAMLPGDLSTYAATYWTRHPNLKPDMLRKFGLAEDTLELKPDARVIVIANNREAGLINGLRATVRECRPDAVIIDTERGQTRTVARHVWEQKDAHGDVIATMEQFPLKLAYALTIHKAQGLTLDAAYCDFRSGFAAGQAYVALSRVRSRESLELAVPLMSHHVRVDPFALQFYRQNPLDTADAPA